MARDQIVRFAVGSPDTPYSGIWRLVVRKNDIYIGASRNSMQTIKISLHESGDWIVAGTTQSGVRLRDGNRRAKQWNRPKEHASGVTRGPSILIPIASAFPRRITKSQLMKPIEWCSPPSSGEMVDFAIYFIKQRSEAQFGSNHTIVWEGGLANGEAVMLLVSAPSLTREFKSYFSQLLKDYEFPISDPDALEDESFIYFTQSYVANFELPVICDLPVPYPKVLPRLLEHLA